MMMTTNRFRRNGTRLLVLLLVLCTVFALAAPALAAATEQVAATTGLNVRSGPSTGYPIIGELKKNQVVTRTGTSGNWSIINLNGVKGYAYSAYLKPTSGGGSTVTTLYATGTVNVRSGPGTGYRVVSTLYKGDAVSKIGTVSNWTIIQWNGGTAYVSSAYLRASGGSNPDVPSDTLTPASGTMKATANVNVRTGPGTNYPKLGFLAKGEKISRTGVIGNWTQVQYLGKTAYVFTSYLTKVSGNDPAPTQTMYVAEETDLRKGPGTSYRLVGILEVGDKVTVYGTTGKWSQVKCGSYEGYCLTSALSYNSAVTKTMYVAEETSLRKGPGTNYSKLGTLEVGDKVIVYSASGNGKWAKVQYGSYIGYCLASTLSANKPSTTKTMYVAEETDLRKGPGTSYRLVGILEVGDKVAVYGTSGKWSEVKCGTYEGYCLTSALSETDITTAAGMAYVTDTVRVRAGASTSYDTLGFLYSGEGAARTGIVGNWTRIQYGRQSGFVPTSSVVILTGSAVSKFYSQKEYVTAPSDYIAAYMIPKGERKYLYGYLEKGDRVLCTGYNDTWTRIEWDGTVLYVDTASITAGSEEESDYVYNDPMWITRRSGARMYTDANLTKRYYHEDSDGELYEVIPRNTKVYFREQVGQSAFKIYWKAMDISVYISFDDAQ